MIFAIFFPILYTVSKYDKEKSPLKVSLYDFDRTIYAADTGTELYLFLFKKRPWLLLFTPLLLMATLLHFLHLLPLAQWKGIMLLPMCTFSLPRWEALVQSFWEGQKKRLFPAVLAQMQDDRQKGMVVGIISASLELFLLPIQEIARPDFLIGTRVTVRGSRILPRLDGPNCKEQEKVTRFRQYMAEHYPGQSYTLEKMVSDSLHDLPLYQEARTQWTVEADGSLRPGLPEAYSKDLIVK